MGNLGHGTSPEGQHLQWNDGTWFPTVLAEPNLDLFFLKFFISELKHG